MILPDFLLVVARPLADGRASMCRPSGRGMWAVHQSLGGLPLLCRLAAHLCTHLSRSKSAARPTNCTNADIRYNTALLLDLDAVGIRKNVVPAS
jgi:hypothetical protein